MPLYEYQCDACGRAFELIRKFSDPPLAKCPHCGGTVRKLLSSPAIQFKGSGFYITDHAKKDQTPGPQAGDAKPDAAAKEAGDKSGEKIDRAEKHEKGGKGERGDKSEKAGKEKAGKDDRNSAKTDKTPAKATAPSKDS